MADTTAPIHEHFIPSALISQHTEIVGILMQFVAGQEHRPKNSKRSGFPALVRASRFMADRVHVAAVCYRLRHGQPEFLLVRTRNGSWTFPKGGVDRDPTTAAAAAREAYEEAGVTGSVEHAPFAAYRHRKPGRTRSRRKVVLVQAHLCEVQSICAPPETFRDPTWFTAEQAKRRLQKSKTAEFAAEVVNIIDHAAERLLNR